MGETGEVEHEPGFCVGRFMQVALFPQPHPPAAPDLGSVVEVHHPPPPPHSGNSIFGTEETDNGWEMKDLGIQSEGREEKSCDFQGPWGRVKEAQDLRVGWGPKRMEEE